MMDGIEAYQQKKTMDKTYSTLPTKELQVTIKPLMARELERIAEIEGVEDPVAFVLLQTAKFIREKKDEYKQRGTQSRITK
jgi:hypothetical protein